jgi:hypothetical protein
MQSSCEIVTTRTKTVSWATQTFCKKLPQSRHISTNSSLASWTYKLIRLTGLGQICHASGQSWPLSCMSCFLFPFLANNVPYLSKFYFFVTFNNKRAWNCVHDHIILFLSRFHYLTKLFNIFCGCFCERTLCPVYLFSVVIADITDIINFGWSRVENCSTSTCSANISFSIAFAEKRAAIGAWTTGSGALCCCRWWDWANRFETRLQRNVCEAHTKTELGRAECSH